MFDFNSLLNVLSFRTSAAADFQRMLAWKLQRAELMLRRTLSDILAPALDAAGYRQLAGRARTYRSPIEILEMAGCLRNSPEAKSHQSLISSFEHAVDAAAQWRAGLPSEVV